MFSFRQFLIENQEKANKTIKWLGDHINKIYSGAATIHDLSNDDAYFAHAVESHPDYNHGEGPEGPEKIGHTMAKLIAHHMDPTPDKRYSQWAWNGWMNDTHQFEDYPRVKEALEKFHANKRVLGNTVPENQYHNTEPKKGSDINAYPDLHHLETHLDKVLNPHKQTNKGEFSHPDAPLIHDQDGLKVHDLKTREASIHTRKCFDNKWCTARDDEHNMFDTYTHNYQTEHVQSEKNAPAKLYHVHMPDGSHWQFHFESDSFADHNDVMHDSQDVVKKYPDLTKVKEFHQYGLKSLPFAGPKPEDRHKMIDDHLDFHIGNYGNIINMGDNEALSILDHAAPRHIDRMIANKPDTTVTTHLFKSNKLSEQQTHKLLDHADSFNSIYSRMYQGALNGNHGKSVGDRLVNHPNKYVRAQVAEHGNDEHREKLLHDPESIVREKVAEHGNKKHLDNFVHDPSSDVRYIVATLGNKKHHDILVNDPSTNVRKRVAEYGHEEHLEKLSKDPDHLVQRVALYNITNPQHMQNIIDHPASEGNKRMAEIKMGIFKDRGYF